MFFLCFEGGFGCYDKNALFVFRFFVLPCYFRCSFLFYVFVFDVGLYGHMGS